MLAELLIIAKVQFDADIVSYYPKGGMLRLQKDDKLMVGKALLFAKDVEDPSMIREVTQDRMTNFRFYVVFIQPRKSDH